MGSYSADILKKAAFQDELTNELLEKEENQDLKPIIAYLQARVKQIDNSWKMI